MWQAPNQRTAASNLSQKRRKERLERPIRLTRVRAEVRLKTRDPIPANIKTETSAADPIEVRVMLNDLSAHGVGVYACEPIAQGTNVTIRLDEPREMVLEGKVAWSKESSDFKVISKTKFSIRVGIKFTFKTSEEEKAFADFLEDLEKNHLYPAPADPGK